MLKRSSYKIIALSFILLVFCVSACDKQDTANSDGPPQQQSVRSPEAERPNYNDITQSTANGQRIQYYSAPFPLKNLSLEELHTKVTEKNAAAMAELGRRYARGIGVTRSLAEAQKLYIQSAEAGDMTAQNELAGAYDYGLLGAVVHEKAVYWYRKAADQGFAPAQFNLAVAYEHGMGITTDFKESHKWYLKAAEQNLPAAQNALAKQFDAGRGVAKNSEKALELYEKAAENNFPEAQYNLAVSYSLGDAGQKNQEKALQLYQQAAKSGYGGAQNNLGVCYLFGEGIDIDYSKAYYWFDLAAKQGIPDAIFNLAQMYENGAYIQKSLVKAYAYYHVSIQILQAIPDETAALTESTFLDSITTLKAQMTPSEIAAGEAEIPKVIQEYGIVL